MDGAFIGPAQWIHRKKFIFADGDVINNCISWQIVSNTVFGFQFSVFG